MTKETAESQSGPSIEAAVAVYSAVAARRVAFDTMLWQVPVIGLTAQAFLLTIALAPDSAATARYISAGLAFLITSACIYLMCRHRQAELTDAGALAQMEESFGVEVQHGVAWRDRRNLESGPATSAFLLWIIVLGVFAAMTLLIIVITMLWPNLIGR